MALPTASDNPFATLLLTEQGSAPASPAAGKRRLYVLSADHLAYLKDSSGAVVNLISNPMTASGDIIYGGASGVPTKLVKGSDGEVLTLASGVPSWAAGAGASNLASAKYKRTSGDYTITGAGSTAFANVDGTNLSLAITTGARRVLISVNATGTTDNAAGELILDIELDGSRLGGTNNGLLRVAQHATASELMNVSFTHLTDVLTAASHTFKLQWKQANTAHTATLRGADPYLTFSVMELYAA